VPASITVGRGTATGPPSYCSPKKFAATWLDQEFEGQEIGCAAFAINYQMNHAQHKYSSKPKRALKEAFKLQKQLGWGKETTISQFSDFTKLYPKWRLAVIQAAFPRSGCVYTGNEFSFDSNDSKKNVIYLLHDSINQHFGLIASPKEVYRKYHGRNDLKFCDECVEVYTPLQDHECSVNPYSKPAKTEQCTVCGRYGKHSCTTTTCKQCKVHYGRGKNGSYVSHRCILYKEPCKNEFMTTTDIPGREKYGQFVYDFESRIETVTTTKSYISEFASKDGFFTTDDYEIVPDGCHSDSPITTITRGPVFSKSLDRHVVNLVCLKNVITGDTQIFEGKNCVEQFLTYLLEYNRGRNIAIAHNGSGYDTRLVFETATKRGLKNLKMVPILQGSKFMQLTIGKLVFRDSMLHLKGSLASLSKDFCPPNTLEKGHFPHLFNTYDNWEYEGIIPGKEFFDLAFVMKDENELARFNQWHDEQVKLFQQGVLWNFQTEIKKYCRNDVDILADVIRGYSTNAEKLVGASPLFKATSPSFVHDTILIDYSKKLNLELPKGQKDFDMSLHQSNVEKIATETGWAVLVPNEYHYARLALRGGRTDVRKLYHDVTEEEHLEGRDIIYQDICSQYPFQQVVHQFPTGTPLIHVWDIKYYPCVRCQNSEQMRDRGTCKCTDKQGDRDCRIVDLVGTQEWTTQQLLERKR
jgi:DNA polymerase type B, organellar and viral